MKRAIVVAAVVICSVALLVWSVTYLRGADRRAFADAESRDTVEAYQAFIRAFPKSSLVEDAEWRISDVAFEAARSADTVDAYEQYLRTYPQGARASEAKEGIRWLREREEASRRLALAAKPLFDKGLEIYLDPASAPSTIVPHAENFELAFVRSPSSRVTEATPRVTYYSKGRSTASVAYSQWIVDVPDTRTGTVSFTNPPPVMLPWALPPEGVMGVSLCRKGEADPISNEVAIHYKSP